MASLSILLKQSFREARNDWREARAQPALKLAVIGSAAVLFELGLFGVFLHGFRFLDSLGAGAMLVNRLFALFFFGLSIMLALSAAAAAYGALFRSRDVPLLLTSPITPADIVLFKWVETARIATWAYLFIVLPFVAAYALYEHGSALFVLWTALFSAPLLALCAAAGILVALLLARFVPSRPLWRRIAGWSLLGGALAALAPWLGRAQGDLSSVVTLSSLVPGLRLAVNPLFPGYWVSEGLAALHTGQWGRGLLFWLLLASTAGALGVLIEWLGARLFFEAWARTVRANPVQSRSRLLRPLGWLLSPLPPGARALVVKDARLFCRDPLQWTQVLVFFGLLGLYFANLRTFRYNLLDDVWRNLIAFLNAFSVAAVLGSLASRFVYPQLSLEGHSFWLLGLSPVSFRRVLLIKYLAAVMAMLAVAVPLMWLSTSMLDTPASTRLTIILLTICIVAALTGLATGLGAVFLDLQNRNPAAIVSGFGGTLNLVLSLLVVLLVIVPFGVLSHLNTTGRIAARTFVFWQVWAWVWAMLVTALATVLPLRAGAAGLRRRDY